MKIKLNNNKFDTLIQPTDWRYSSAIVGLVTYLKYSQCDFKFLSELKDKPHQSINGFDGVLYKQCDITEEKFLIFAEYYFKADMTHIKISEILNEDEFDTEKIKKVNELLKKKTILKNIFGDKKFDGTNKEYFLNTIEKNRLNIIKEIFRYAPNMYRNFCNENLLFTKENPHCRLVGYNVDEVRKSKSVGFGFSKESFVASDISEFDFIPFAFSKTSESYFINNNYTVELLIKTKEYLEDKLNNINIYNSKTKLLYILKNSYEFFNYDVEIICKSRNEEYYKTQFVRLKNLNILKSITTSDLNFRFELNEKYQIDIEKEVYERCLNNVLLDDIIEIMLKLYFNKDINKETIRFKTDLLIKINESWRGNLLMNEIESAKKTGFVVSKELAKFKKENKAIAYKQKIISALVAHDYDRMNEVILSLAGYIGMEFNFAYPLFENPEENKNIAFAFANALTNNKGE